LARAASQVGVASRRGSAPKIHGRIDSAVFPELTDDVETAARLAAGKHIWKSSANAIDCEGRREKPEMSWPWRLGRFTEFSVIASD